LAAAGLSRAAGAEAILNVVGSKVKEVDWSETGEWNALHLAIKYDVESLKVRLLLKYLYKVHCTYVLYSARLGKQQYGKRFETKKYVYSMFLFYMKTKTCFSNIFLNGTSRM
jgi:hypothetical protein